MKQIPAAIVAATTASMTSVVPDVAEAAIVTVPTAPHEAAVADLVAVAAPAPVVMSARPSCSS